MKDNIFELANHISIPAQPAEDKLEHETFLVEEGLDLLAAYRSIADKSLRLALKALIETVSRSQREARLPPA